MTKEEELVLDRLTEAWNAFLKLGQVGQCEDDLSDFRKAIHDAQRIVMSRKPPPAPTVRGNRFPQPGDPIAWTRYRPKEDAWAQADQVEAYEAHGVIIHVDYLAQPFADMSALQVQASEATTGAVDRFDALRHDWRHLTQEEARKMGGSSVVFRWRI
jgi:hypothetical protein